MKELHLRFGLGKIDKDIYKLALDHLNSELLAITKEMNIGKVKIFNFESLLKNALKQLQNLNIIWSSGDLEEKRALQKTLFP